MDRGLNFVERFTADLLDDLQFIDMQVFLDELAHRLGAMPPHFRELYSQLPSDLHARLDYLRLANEKHIREVYPPTHEGMAMKHAAMKKFREVVLSVQSKPMIGSDGKAVLMDDVIEYLDNLPYPNKDNAPSR